MDRKNEMSTLAAQNTGQKYNELLLECEFLLNAKPLVLVLHPGICFARDLVSQIPYRIEVVVVL
jgi:hypothetical protein